MNRRLSVRAMVIREGKLLCVRQRPNKLVEDTGQKIWNLPGGGLDALESLTDCLKREMLEETGIAPAVGNLMYIQQFQHNDTEYLEFFFNVTNSEDYLDVDLSNSTHGEAELLEIAYISPSENVILPKFLTSEPIFEKADSPTTVITYL